MTKHRGLIPWLAVIAVGALILAACGSEESETTAAPSGAGSRTEEVAASDPVGLVMAAVDLVDTAGFHSIAEDLATAPEINPRYAGQISSVVTAVTATTWPSELQTAVDALRGDLVALQQALEDGDLAAGRAAAEAVHESQHDFSHAAYGWLQGASGGNPLATIMGTLDMVDTVGFHGMAEDLAAATEISPRYAGQVGNVVTALGATDWTSDLEASADAFASRVGALRDALDAGDLAAARAAAEAVHESQHDFSHSVYGWLAEHEGGTEAALGPHYEANMMAVHLKSVDMMDTVGLHDMATDLATATEINPRYASQVGNLLLTIRVAEWPAELAGAAATFASDLDTFKAALEAGDLDAARTAAEAVHESQHDLSHSFYGWLGEH